MKTFRSGLLAVACAATLIPTPVAAGGARSCFDGPDKTTRGMMRGDVDGDGNRDEVWVGARKRGGDCRYFVFVRTDSSTMRQRLHGDGYSLRHDVRPIAVVKVDGVAGREVAVKMFQGAATGGLAFFTLRDGDLKKMEATGKGAPPSDVFLFSGSLSGMYAVDCARPDDTILMSEAYPKNYEGSRRKWIVERRRFRVEGHDFVRTDRRTQREEVRFRRIDNRFREFQDGGLLPHCVGNVD